MRATYVCKLLACFSEVPQQYSISVYRAKFVALQEHEVPHINRSSTAAEETVGSHFRSQTLPFPESYKECKVTQYPGPT